MNHKNRDRWGAASGYAVDWESHLPYLRDCYREWQFTEMLAPTDLEQLWAVIGGNKYEQGKYVSVSEV